MHTQKFQSQHQGSQVHTITGGLQGESEPPTFPLTPLGRGLSKTQCWERIPSISKSPNIVHLCVYVYIYAWSIMKSYLKPRFQLHFPTTRTKFSLQIAALQWNQRATLLEAAWQQNEPVNSSRYSSARHGRGLEMEQIIYKKKVIQSNF